MVALVMALRGLKAMLPRSLTHSSWRIRDLMGAFSPALMRAAESCLHRSLEDPSNSPMENRSPSVCSMTPGSAISAAG